MAGEPGDQDLGKWQRRRQKGDAAGEPGDEAMVPGAKGSATYFKAVGDAGDDFASTLPTIDDKAALDAVLAKGSGKVVVDVMAPWCAKCRLIAPHVKALQAAHPDVTFVKVDTTRAKGRADALGVSALPAFTLYDGGREAGSAPWRSARAASTTRCWRSEWRHLQHVVAVQFNTTQGA